MDVYAFPLSPADIIRPESIDELIERRAREALAEIRRMADEARARFAPPPLTVAQRSAAYALEQLRGMQNDPARFSLHGQLAQSRALGQFGLTQRQDRLQTFAGF